MSVSRREIIGGSICCAGCAAVIRQAQAQSGRLPAYCSLDQSFDTDAIRHFSSSGDDQLDRSLIAELLKVNRVFNVNPGYRYFDDERSPNAFAFKKSLIDGTRGTVFFGVELIYSELSESYGGAAIAGIAAHEAAHVMQFYSAFAKRLVQGETAREIELHADYLAGYYFGAIGRSDRSIDAFGASLFSKGGYDFNDPQHHGTPDERLEAMHAGYRSAAWGDDLQSAIERGLKHVLS